MRKIILILLCALGTMCYAQDSLSTATPVVDVSTPRYIMVPTKNIWTFLKLDTRTGRIWQVQFSVEGDDYRFQSVLSEDDVTFDNDYYDGRYTLYPTENIHNFLLLDQANGRVWQVQWGKADERMMIRIR